MSSLVWQLGDPMIRSVFLSMVFCGALFAQSATSTSSSKSNPTPAPAKSATPANSSAKHTSYHRQTPDQAARYYRLVWGVEDLNVSWAESGEIIKFTYQVVDADKAKALNDKKAEPRLVAPRAGVALVVPSLEKVGALRQSSTPVSGKIYWMAFSNKGRLVKRGDQVNVVIGPFHAEGLIVD
jgi:hypothetical protein